MPIPPRAGRPVVLEVGHPPQMTETDIANLNSVLRNPLDADANNSRWDNEMKSQLQAPDLGEKTASRKMEPSLIVVEDVLAMLERMKSEYAARGYRFEFDISFSLKKESVHVNDST